MADDDISKILEKILAKTVGTGIRDDGKKKNEPVREHEIVYDSPSETLEPIYFWILDFMQNMFGGKVEKLMDNFSATPGSGYFSELSGKKTVMQKNVTETLGTVNTVIKSIVNIIYDLKDFEIRLDHYKAAKDKDKNIASAGNLALKQIWMDNVDIKRGNGSINALASGNLQFVTLRDAFLFSDTIEQIDKELDLNDRVKRILKPRLAEFLKWRELSEQELVKRYNIEINYLKSQVNMLQLYSRWVKPYLKSATQLEMKDDDRNPSMVTAFSTIWLQLTILGKNPVNFEEAQITYQMPKRVKKPKRTYYSVVIVDFKFRGIPQKVGQNYSLGGRATVSFKGYALNDEEITLLDQELKKSDLNDILKYIEGGTTESLDELKKDIDSYIKKDEKKAEEDKKKKEADINPFSALFNFMKTEKKDEKKKDEKKELVLEKVKKDDYLESMLRKIAANGAQDACFGIFDVFKKSRGMASHDNPWE